MKTLRALTVAVASGAVGACLVVAPLDDVEPVATAGGGGATGGDGGGGASGDGSASCVTHTDCAAELANEPARCLSGKCLPLKTPNCRCVRGPWDDPNSIIVGAFAPDLGLPGQCGEDSASINYRLALQEFNDKGGLPGDSDEERPLALVLCDNGAEAYADLPSLPANQRAAKREQIKTDIQESVRYLAEDLKVPAAIAFLAPDDLKTAVQDYAQPRGVFFMAPSVATQTLADLSHGGYLWHMLGLASDVAPAYAALVERLSQHDAVLKDPYMNQFDPSGDLGNGLVRVALVRGKNSYEDELVPELLQLLTFNGKSAADNEVDGRFKQYDVSAGAAAIGNDIKTNFLPHIVVSTTGSALNDVVNEADTGWLPFYVLSPLNLELIGPLLDTIEATADHEQQPTLHDKFIGVNTAITEDSDLLKAYESRLSTFSSGAQLGTENFYDAAYFTFYALLAGGANGTGASDTGMADLIQSGLALSVGPDDMGAIKNFLKSGDQIRLQGIGGPPTFDQQKQVKRGTGGLYCFISGPTKQLQVRDHVGHYDHLANPPHLRLAKEHAGGPPCLQWLGLPAQ